MGKTQRIITLAAAMATALDYTLLQEPDGSYQPQPNGLSSATAEEKIAALKACLAALEQK